MFYSVAGQRDVKGRTSGLTDQCGFGLSDSITGRTFAFNELLSTRLDRTFFVEELSCAL